MADWKEINSCPKQPSDDKDVNVTMEFVVLLFDPDNDIDNRIQVGFWNNVINDWQTLFDNTELMRPTHWMPLPAAPVT